MHSTNQRVILHFFNKE